jgi:hypothetical protein
MGSESNDCILYIESKLKNTTKKRQYIIKNKLTFYENM